MPDCNFSCQPTSKFVKNNLEDPQMSENYKGIENILALITEKQSEKKSPVKWTNTFDPFDENCSNQFAHLAPILQASDGKDCLN